MSFISFHPELAAIIRIRSQRSCLETDWWISILGDGGIHCGNGYKLVLFLHESAGCQVATEPDGFSGPNPGKRNRAPESA